MGDRLRLKQRPLSNCKGMNDAHTHLPQQAPMSRISWLTTFLVTLATPALANGIGMSTTWQDIQLDRTQCLHRAKLSLWRSGFWQNTTIDRSSISAENRDYTAAIRCFPEKQTVVFVVAGQDSAKADDLKNLISKNF